MLAAAPGRIRRLLADKGYDADWLRADLRTSGIVPVIPGTRSRKRPIRHDKLRYKDRWRAEAVFCRSRTSAASRPATTSSPVTMPQPSPSQPSSRSGADRVRTLALQLRFDIYNQ